MQKDRKNRIGRPQLGDQKRRFRISASFTQEEKNRIFQKALEAKISPSDFLYRAALKREIAAPPSTVNLAAVRELNAIGKNLNLFVREAYFRDPHDLYMIDRYFEMLSEIKMEILGVKKDDDCESW